MSETKSLLPTNTAQGVRDFETATARLGDLPVEINKLWNPAKCPEHLLGWLAWALSVDVWDQSWSEETKRSVLSESVKVHRIKGTKKAVRDALSAVGLKAQISEWFETGAPPYTFQVEAYSDDAFASAGGINQKTFDLVQSSIEHVKSARDQFDLRFGIRTEHAIYAGVAPLTQLEITVQPLWLDPDPVYASPKVGVAPYTQLEISVFPKAA